MGLLPSRTVTGPWTISGSLLSWGMQWYVQSAHSQWGAGAGLADGVLGQDTATLGVGLPLKKKKSSKSNRGTCLQLPKAWGSEYPRSSPSTQLPTKMREAVSLKPLLRSPIVLSMVAQLKACPSLCKSTSCLYMRIPNPKTRGWPVAGAPNLAEPPSKTYIHQMGC